MGEYTVLSVYDFPQENESYVHRIARTRRAGKSRAAISFATPTEDRLMGSWENSPSALQRRAFWYYQSTIEMDCTNTAR